MNWNNASDDTAIRLKMSTYRESPRALLASTGALKRGMAEPSFGENQVVVDLPHDAGERVWRGSWLEPATLNGECASIIERSTP